jgi:hypothetical protein
MKKLMTILLLAFFIPQITLASWWNPLSWFKSESVVAIPQKLPIIPIQEATSTKSTIIEKSTEKVVEKIVEKPVDRIVEKVITIDNPQLKIQTEQLMKENANLKKEISFLTSSLNQCRMNSAIIDNAESENSKNLKEVTIALAKIDQISIKINIISKDPNNVSSSQVSEVYQFRNIDNEQIIPKPFNNDYQNILDWVRRVRPIIQNEKSRLLVLQAQYQ